MRFTDKIYRVHFGFLVLAFGLVILLASLFLFTSSSRAATSNFFQYDFPLKVETLNTSIIDPITVTFQIYLPIINNPLKLPRPIGTVGLLSGPIECDNQNCYDVEVNCPDVTQSITATLKVGEPITTTRKGTILFVTGWTGTYFFAGGPEISTHYRRIAGGRIPDCAAPMGK